MGEGRGADPRAGLVAPLLASHPCVGAAGVGAGAGSAPGIFGARKGRRVPGADAVVRPALRPILPPAPGAELRFRGGAGAHRVLAGDTGPASGGVRVRGWAGAQLRPALEGHQIGQLVPELPIAAQQLPHDHVADHIPLWEVQIGPGGKKDHLVRAWVERVEVARPG